MLVRRVFAFEIFHNGELYIIHTPEMIAGHRTLNDKEKKVLLGLPFREVIINFMLTNHVVDFTFALAHKHWCKRQYTKVRLCFHRSRVANN